VVADDSDDRELFRQSIGPIRTVHTDRVVHRRRPAAVPEQRRLDESRVVEELAQAHFDFIEIESGEELSWHKPDVPRRVLNRLRRGHWRVQDEIDLHSMNVAAASNTVRAFVDEARRAGLCCIKIIHGKGLRSGPDGPRLKQTTARILSRLDCVCAFASAPPHDGGTGAVYVLLSGR